ncbi:MAG: hypothetical protein VB026_02715 [Anaerolineaceae bacterium]|nr:hypothetical protein [Anaerolineaceae bacterium]
MTRPGTVWWSPTIEENGLHSRIEGDRKQHEEGVLVEFGML